MQLPRLSRYSECAVVATIYIAKNEGRGLIGSRTISELHNIHGQYLSQVLRHLVGSGILRGRTGNNGGYKLAKPAEDISIGEIIESVDGSLMPTHLFKDFPRLGDSGKNAAHHYTEACKKARDYLLKIKIKDLL